MRRFCDFEALTGGTKPVLALPALYKKLEKIPGPVMAGFVRAMQLYSEEKPLPETHFKKEQRIDIGHGKSYLVWAFKNKHFRIYGARETIESFDCFICSEHDDNKKCRSADMNKLTSAAKKLKSFMDNENA